MEVGLHSFKLEKKEMLYSQSVPFFLLALSISLWCNVIVSAGPSTSINIEKKLQKSKYVGVGCLLFFLVPFTCSFPYKRFSIWLCETV